MDPLPASVLPAGVRARVLPGINGLDIHVLEAGYETPGRPAVLLLHGFPELAYSWRKVMPALAAAGYHAIAPDQRGYGRTTGWDADYDGDLAGFRFMNLLRDAIGVLFACGHRTAEAVVGHDFGASVAAYAALVRPDIFTRMVLMSAPFCRSAVGAVRPARREGADIHAALAALAAAAQALPVVLLDASGQREHVACQAGRARFPARLLPPQERRLESEQAVRARGLDGRRAGQDADLLHHGSRRRHGRDVAKEMPSAAEIAANRWLPDAELEVYSEEYARNGFQGGLNWYRVRTGGKVSGELEVFTGRTVDVPSTFISGRSDWGIYQTPGAIERMQKVACTKMKEIHLIEGAGHWVQQEQPDEVNRLLLQFLETSEHLPPPLGGAEARASAASS